MLFPECPLKFAKKSWDPFGSSLTHQQHALLSFGIVLKQGANVNGNAAYSDGDYKGESESIPHALRIIASETKTSANQRHRNPATFTALWQQIGKVRGQTSFFARNLKQCRGCANIDHDRRAGCRLCRLCKGCVESCVIAPLKTACNKYLLESGGAQKSLYSLS